MPDPKKLIGPLFDMLASSLGSLSREEYSRPITMLHGATIGQHVRHILDMFLCVARDLPQGIVNYESRQRDPLIETDPTRAISTMEKLLAELPAQDRPLEVEGSYDVGSGTPVRARSTYHRELLYNFEHTVHHMALIRIGLMALGHVDVPEGFGVAPSTMKHRQACAQ